MYPGYVSPFCLNKGPGLLNIKKRGTWSSHPRQRAAACEDLVPSEDYFLSIAPLTASTSFLTRVSSVFLPSGGESLKVIVPFPVSYFCSVSV